MIINGDDQQRLLKWFVFNNKIIEQEVDILEIIGNCRCGRSETSVSK